MTRNKFKEKIPIIVIGAQINGNAGSVLEIIGLMGKFEVVGFIDNAEHFQNSFIEDIPVLGKTDDLIDLDLPTSNFHIAIGDNVTRQKIANKLIEVNRHLITLVHPTSIISNDVKIGDGCFIGPGVIIRGNVHIGNVTKIKSGSIIASNVNIGSGVSLLHGVNVGRSVKIGDNTLVGMSTSIMPNIHIGAGILIDTNIVIRENVMSGVTMDDYSAKDYPKNIVSDAKPDIFETKPIYIAQPTLPEYSKIHKSFLKIFESKMLSNFAQFSDQLEINLQSILNVRKTLTFPNCTSALMLSVKALDLSGEVIIPSFTFSATGHSILWNGLRPVFADINPKTFNIDPDDVERKISSKTSAIMAVHIFGNPCNIKELETIAKKYKLKLIFDSAHALGSEYRGKMIGTFGDIECFSLSGTKVITSAEGGIAASNDMALINKMNLGRNYGSSDDYNCKYLGLNGKMSEFHAAIAVESIALLSYSVLARNKIAKLYKKLLSTMPGIIFQDVMDNNISTYKDFGIIIDSEKFGMNRDQLYLELANESIYTKKYFFPVLHKMDIYKEIYPKLINLNLTNTNFVSNNILCLPIYSHLNEDTVEKICFSIYRIWKNVN